MRSNAASRGNTLEYDIQTQKAVKRLPFDKLIDEQDTLKG